MTRHRYRVGVIAAVLAALLAVPVIAGPAAAISPAGVVNRGPGPDAGVRPTSLDVFACSRRGGTNPWDLAAGVPASITEFWLTRTQEQAQQFIDTSVLHVAVNGVAVADPDSYWQLRAPSEADGLWLALWLYDTGVQTKAGGTITMSFRHDLPEGTYDGFDVYPPGTALYDFTCTAKVLGSRDSSAR
jgi:hypothetical protein